MMDIYTTSNFRKGISTIVNNVLKQKKPVEITSTKTDEKGATETVVVLPKDEYQKLIDLQDQLVAQANQSIAEKVMKMNPPTLTTDEEIEAWLGQLLGTKVPSL